MPQLTQIFVGVDEEKQIIEPFWQNSMSNKAALEAEVEGEFDKKFIEKSKRRGGGRVCGFGRLGVVFRLKRVAKFQWWKKMDQGMVAIDSEIPYTLQTLNHRKERGGFSETQIFLF